METRRCLRIECLLMVGRLESKRSKVAALNLFHPTAPPVSERSYFHVVTQSHRGKGEGLLQAICRLSLRNLAGAPETLPCRERFQTVPY